MEEEGSTLTKAAPQIPREVVFTTHTPVPAGHDRFNAALIEEHLGPLREETGTLARKFDGLWARVSDGPIRKPFCMTVLGLKLSRRANAVSVAAWRGIARDVAGALSRRGRRRSADRAHHQRRARAVVAGAADAPAVRSPSWEWAGSSTARAAQTWEEIENVDDGELWETHLSLKSRLLDFARAARASRPSGAASRRRICSGWARCCRPTR